MLTAELQRTKYAGQPEEAKRSVDEIDGAFWFNDDPIKPQSPYGTKVIGAGQSFYIVSGKVERTEDELRAAYAAAELNARSRKMKRLRHALAGRWRSCPRGRRWIGAAAVSALALWRAGLFEAAGERLIGWVP